MEEHLLLILDYITPNKYPKNEPKRSFLLTKSFISSLYFSYMIFSKSAYCSEKDNLILG